MSLTPLEDNLKALIFALNDSAEALVLLLLKKRSAAAVEDVQIMRLNRSGNGFKGI